MSVKINNFIAVVANGTLAIEMSEREILAHARDIIKDRLFDSNDTVRAAWYDDGPETVDIRLEGDQLVGTGLTRNEQSEKVVVESSERTRDLFRAWNILTEEAKECR